jgi:hypothetical protein
MNNFIVPIVIVLALVGEAIWIADVHRRLAALERHEK